MSRSAAVEDAEEDGLGVVTTTTVGLAEAIQRQAAVDPAFREKAIALVTSWLNDAQAGNPAMLSKAVDQPETAMTADEAQQLLTALQANAAPPVQAIAPTGTPSAQPSTLTLGQPSTVLGALNPNSFPVRGEPGSKYSWKNIRMRLEYKNCAERGCPVTQWYEVRIGVDPNSKSSRLTSESTHWKKSVDRMNGIHVQNYAVVRGVTVNDPDHDNHDLPDGSGPSTWYVGTPWNLQGNVLTQAPALWIKVNGYWVSEGGKTADAKCNTNKDKNKNTNCLYY